MSEKPILNQYTFLKAFITSKHTFPSIPSASGVEAFNGLIFIVGDDSPWIYILNDRAEFVTKVPLLAISSSTDGRIPKNEKPDFESMTVMQVYGQNKLLIAGSGSLSPQRDTGFLIDLEPPYAFQMISLTKVYEQLRLIPEVIGSGKLNIEGMAASQEKIYMVQRGNITGKNILISYDLMEFYDLITGKNTRQLLPDLYEYSLPMLADKQSGFSGITFIPDSNALLFTASVEDTIDEIADGVILGSFTGILHLHTQEAVYIPVTENGSPYIGKIESISILKHTVDSHTIEAIAVTDNDAGSSDLLFLTVQY